MPPVRKDPAKRQRRDTVDVSLDEPRAPYPAQPEDSPSIVADILDDMSKAVVVSTNLAGVPATTVPRPPAKIDAKAKRIWNAFWTSPIASAVDPRSDLHRVERWIYWIDQFEKTKAKIETEGLVTMGSTGQQTLGPLSKWLITCEAAIQRAEQDMGLTPRARAQLGVTLSALHRTAKEISEALDDVPDEDLNVIQAQFRVHD